MAITTTARAALGDFRSKHDLNRPEMVGLELTAGDPEPALRDLFGKVGTWDTRPINDLSNLGFGTYDLIVAVETLATVQNVTATVGLLSEIVKPGGYVIITGRVWGGAPAPGDRLDKPSGLIWKFVPANLSAMLTYACFDTDAAQQDDMGKHFSPGFFLIARKRMYPYGQLIGTGSYREGDEVPDTPQTYV